MVSLPTRSARFKQDRLDNVRTLPLRPATRPSTTVPASLKHDRLNNTLTLPLRPATLKRKRQKSPDFSLFSEWTESEQRRMVNGVDSDSQATVENIQEDIEQIWIDIEDTPWTVDKWSTEITGITKMISRDTLAESIELRLKGVEGRIAEHNSEHDKNRSLIDEHADTIRAFRAALLSIKENFVNFGTASGDVYKTERDLRLQAKAKGKLDNKAAFAAACGIREPQSTKRKRNRSIYTKPMPFIGRRGEFEARVSALRSGLQAVLRRYRAFKRYVAELREEALDAHTLVLAGLALEEWWLEEHGLLRDNVL